MKFSALFVGFAVALCTAAPVGAQTLAAWEQPVNVVAADGALTKSAGCDMCPDAGAHSVARLTNAGYTEFIATAGQRFSAGLTTEAVPNINGSQVDYAVSIWPNGAFEIRERGVYRADGTFTDGDTFRISIEGGAIVYRRNGTRVYTSAVAPSGPMALSATLLSTGASIHGAVLYFNSDFTTDVPPQQPQQPPITVSELPLGIVSVGPYQAIVERLPHAKPAPPVLGPAGTWITDPVFQSRILRVTDNMTRPGTPDRSFRSPSSPHQNAWSANGSYFWVVSGDGTIIPFAFDARRGTASRIQPTTTGLGGMILKFSSEPQFSYLNDTQIYGNTSAQLHVVQQYDFATNVYSPLLDLDTVVPGLTGTYIGGISSSGANPERIMVFFGGQGQDYHHYVAVFEKNDPSKRILLDSLASTIDGAPTSTPLGFKLHHVAIDRSGRYVMLYTTYADQQSTRKAAQSYLWDTQTGSIAEMGLATRPYGHDAFGYGVSVNQDCCALTRWDAAQWQFRNLATPLTSTDVIKTVLSPKEVALADHTTWNNARPDALVPFISGLYRAASSTAEWRAWDDEIVAIQSDAGAADPTVWRFAHHRTDVRADNNPAAGSFWYTPRPNVSHDGRWVMFTSNWEKTLGTDLTGDLATRSRQDVFIVELKPSAPPRPDVTLDASALPVGRSTVAYAAALHAAGGNGTYAWRVSSGTLPTGLSLDAGSGAISGVPTVANTFTFDVQVWDPAEPTNSATASYAITIAPAPIALTAPALPSGRLTVPYSAALKAAGGSGAYAWSVSQGALPPGLTMDAATGAIGGMPQTMGTYAFTVAVADATESANAAAAAATITIGASPVVIAPATVPAARERVSFKLQLSASGGSGKVAWSVAAGVLPAGLTLNANTGQISGTPTKAGTYAVTIAATDTADPTNVGLVDLTFTVSLGVKVGSPRVLPAASVNVFYSYQLVANNVQGTAKWNLQGGEMPPGITLSTTGLISGTCPVSGTWYFNARVRDVSTDHTLTLTLVVQ